MSIIRKFKDNLSRSLSNIININNSGYKYIEEPFIGAFQRNKDYIADRTQHPTVFACLSLISNDIAKLPFTFKTLEDKHWKRVYNSQYSFLNSKPNKYQTPYQFRQQWILSKLMHGNTYVLIERDELDNPVAFHILNPDAVQVRISDVSGSIFYAVKINKNAGDSVFTLTDNNELIIPASEIIHDKCVTIYSPFVGVSPIRAAALSINMSHNIQSHMNDFIQNGASLGGIVEVPGAIKEEQSKAILRKFNEDFKGRNSGNIGLLTDGMKFNKLSMSSLDAQLIDHMKYTTEQICGVFNVPVFMIISNSQASNVEELTQQYYSQCLQTHIKSLENCLDFSLEISDYDSIEIDTNELFRGDMTKRYANYEKAIKASFMTINEARYLEDLPPLDGADTVYMQQQNFSLQAIYERDKNDPFSKEKVIQKVEIKDEEVVEEKVDRSYNEEDLIKQLSESIAKKFGE